MTVARYGPDLIGGGLIINTSNAFDNGDGEICASDNGDQASKALALDDGDVLFCELDVTQIGNGGNYRFRLDGATPVLSGLIDADVAGSGSDTLTANSTSTGLTILLQDASNLAGFNFVKVRKVQA